MDLSRWIERHASFAPGKAAIRFEGRTLSYADLARRIEGAAQVLKHSLGVGRGDRVAHLGHNSPDMLALLFACARLGAMLVPLNWRLALPELQYILADCAADVLLCDQAYAESAAAFRRSQPRLQVVGIDFAAPGVARLDDLLAAAAGDSAGPHVDLSCPLLVVYTSGTTGRPKGAVLTQGAVHWNALMSQHMHDLTSADHVLTVLPMFHVGGLNIQTVPALLAGATVTLHRRFDPAATLQAIGADRPSLVVLVPATMYALLRHPGWRDADLSSLRALATGSQIVPLDAIDGFEARGVPVVQVYGATETGPVSIYQKVGTAPHPPGSTGRPGLAVEARVVGQAGEALPDGRPGEIALRAPNLLVEYWGDAEATAAAFRDGWYLTGDMGVRDADGTYRVLDRRRNVIISGGENIYPAEVERVLQGIAGIAECCVVGRADPHWGEVPVAVVVRAAGGPDRDAILAACAGQIARFKQPRDVIFVEALPRNAMGKVQSFRVKELAAAPGRRAPPTES